MASSRAPPSSCRSRSHSADSVSSAAASIAAAIEPLSDSVAGLPAHGIVGLLPYRRDPLAEQLSDDDWRKTNPRFTDENFQRNLRIVDEVQAVLPPVRPSPTRR